MVMKCNLFCKYVMEKTIIHVTLWSPQTTSFGGMLVV